jgi:hypothetical protein
MRFDTKVAVVVDQGLLPWQKLNVTAFTISGVAGLPDILGEPYEDGSGRRYLPMIRQPILVFEATPQDLRSVYGRAIEAGLAFTVYTAELFGTAHDEANRAAVKARTSSDLPLVGMALRGPRKSMDRVLQGLQLHP